ncbi:MAG: MFS transporter [Cyanobacteria bacterium P01_F01_bin.42]
MTDSAQSNSLPLAKEQEHPPSYGQLGILMAAGALSSAVGSMVAPVFPEVKQALQVSPWWAGTLVGVHTLTMALATPLLGLLANRVGHRRVLVGSLIAYGIFGMLGALAINFGTMFLSRALVGAASGGVAVISIGVLSGSYEGEARTKMMGYATSALASSTVFFPILGGWIGSLNWRYAFCLNGIAFPVAIAALFFLEIPAALNPVNANLKDRSVLLNVVRQRRVLTILFTLAFASALFYVVVVYAPLYLKEAMDAKPLVNGFVLATRAVGAAIVSAFGASRLAKWLGAQKAIALGFLLMSLSLISIPLVQSPILIVVSALPFGFGFGVVMPNLYDRLSNCAPTAQQTILLGIGTGISSLGQFFSPTIFGPIWATLGAIIFFVAGTSGLLWAALMSFTPPQEA